MCLGGEDSVCEAPVPPAPPPPIPKAPPVPCPRASQFMMEAVAAYSKEQERKRRTGLLQVCLAPRALPLA